MKNKDYIVFAEIGLWRIELDCIRLDWIGWGWIRLDWIGFAGIGLAWIAGSTSWVEAFGQLILELSTHRLDSPG